MEPRSRAWRVLALLAIVGNVAFNYISENVQFGEGGMVTMSQRYQNLFTPAGYAFSIWGVIYTAFLVYAIVALLPSQRVRAIHDRLAPPLALANVLGSVWIVVFRMNWIPVSLLVMAATVAVAIVMYRRALAAFEQRELGTRWWTVPFALFLGWISVAAIANASIFLVSIGWHGAPWSEASVAIAMIAVTGVLGLAVAALAHESVVPGVIAWANVAIWYETRALYGDVALAAMLVAVIAGAAAVGSTVSRVIERMMRRTMPYRVGRSH